MLTYQRRAALAPISRIRILALVLCTASMVSAQTSYEVSVAELTGTNVRNPHAAISAPGDIGLLHYERGFCNPNSLWARASLHSLHTRAGMWICNTTGNGSETRARAIHEDLVFQAPAGTATVQVPDSGS